jgi:serine/threonine protein kinase
MASVYWARGTRLNRFVARKLLRQEFAGDAILTAWLQEEARITASIKHPHVIEVFSPGGDHGQFYRMMELVDGGNLDDRMEDEKRISEMEKLEASPQAAGEGLPAAFQAGLIHRAFKPGNILLRIGAPRRSLILLAAQHARSGSEIALLSRREEVAGVSFASEKGCAYFLYSWSPGSS